MFFYPMYQEFFGVRNACRLGIVLTMPLCVGLAVPSLLPLPALGMQLILAGVLFFKNINATNSFTSAVIMVNAAGKQPPPTPPADHVGRAVFFRNANVTITFTMIMLNAAAKFACPAPPRIAEQFL